MEAPLLSGLKPLTSLPILTPPYSKLKPKTSLLIPISTPRFLPIIHRPNPTRPISTVRSEIAAAADNQSYPLYSRELHVGPRIRALCFYSLTAAAAIPLFAAMAAVHPLVLLFDRHRRRAHHVVAGLWAAWTIRPFYRFEFQGVENLPARGTAAVYVSNHQSFLDIYTLLTLGREFKFISKTAIFMIPIVGWAMFLMGMIPLQRMDSRSQLDCLKRCIDLVNKGASVFFFPEGTRSKDGKLGSFKKGAFSVAVKTKVPVVPITLVGTGKLMPAGMESVLNPGAVKVVFHKPIEGIDADVLCKEARSTIADTLVLHGYGVHSAELRDDDFRRDMMALKFPLV